MPLPAAFDTITVTGTYVDFLGAAGTGTITFTPNPAAWLKATASDVVIVPKPRSVTLSASGTFSIALPVTNDPDVLPSFSYTVTEDVSGFTRTQAIEIPATLLPGPVDLSDLTTTGAVPTGTTALTKTVADTLYAPIGGGGGGGALTDGSVTEVKMQAAFLRTIEAVLRWDGTGTQPLRSTVTADMLRPVRWRQPTAPPTTTGYAISGLDVWEQTP